MIIIVRRFSDNAGVGFLSFVRVRENCIPPSVFRSNCWKVGYDECVWILLVDLEWWISKGRFETCRFCPFEKKWIFFFSLLFWLMFRKIFFGWRVMASHGQVTLYCVVSLFVLHTPTFRYFHHCSSPLSYGSFMCADLGIFLFYIVWKGAEKGCWLFPKGSSKIGNGSVDNPPWRLNSDGKAYSTN